MSEFHHFMNELTIENTDKFGFNRLESLTRSLKNLNDVRNSTSIDASEFVLLDDSIKLLCKRVKEYCDFVKDK